MDVCVCVQLYVCEVPQNWDHIALLLNENGCVAVMTELSQGVYDVTWVSFSSPSVNYDGT